MSDQTLSAARFHNYWKLLKLAAPWVDIAIIFTEDGNFCWQSNRRLHQQMDRITILTQRFQKEVADQAVKEVHKELGDGEMLTLMQLGDPEIDVCLTVALISHEIKRIKKHAVTADETILLLNQSLLTEYCLIKKNLEKEQELNAIADELTHRYEELNLIYSSDDNVQNLSHGRELLQQIVVNASNFLDVDLVAVLLPEKNVSLHYSRQAHSPQQYKFILNALRQDIFMQLQIHKKSLVINSSKDAMKTSIFIDLPYKVVVAPMLNAENKVIGLIAIVNEPNRIDFSNSDRNLLEVLANKASTIVVHNFDPLTGLENSHSFEMIVLDTLKQAWQNGSHHAIANIDIDRMAVINAISGLEAGDKLIKQVGSTLSKMVRSYDTVARLGADKFAVLLKNCDLEKAQMLMKKIAEVISKLELNWENEVHEVSISVGIAPITADIQTVSSVLSNVESARIAAKERGRNQIQVFKLDDSDLLRRKKMIHWVSKTQAALREDRFELYAQKIMPINEIRELPHYEVLIRMLDDEGNIIPPGDFLPAAENFYLMPKLDRWVIRQTLKMIGDMQKQTGMALCEVAINLSGQSITSEGLAGYIEFMLKQYAVNPEMICFEVTETAAMANIEEAQAFIRNIRQLGCSFSLDDFGTGLSSFAYLKNLDVDFLKIDGTFVKNIVEDEVSYSMVSAITQGGHAMKLRTIAEYVENDDILQRLQQLGIDYAQGYGIERPQPLTQTLNKLLVEDD
jgi:diguanylate cyclase (GGDEF)-like protein